MELVSQINTSEDQQAPKLDDDNDMSNIYDSPKVPPIPVVSAASKGAVASGAVTTSHDTDSKIQSSSNSEALQVKLHQQQSPTREEVVYDVPRSNPRKVEQAKQKTEAIYVNNSFQDSQSEKENNYDVPRTAKNSQQQVSQKT